MPQPREDLSHSCVLFNDHIVVAGGLGEGDQGNLITHDRDTSLTQEVYIYSALGRLICFCENETSDKGW